MSAASSERDDRRQEEARDGRRRQCERGSRAVRMVGDIKLMARAVEGIDIKDLKSSPTRAKALGFRRGRAGGHERGTKGEHRRASRRTSLRGSRRRSGAQASEVSEARVAAANPTWHRPAARTAPRRRGWRRSRPRSADERGLSVHQFDDATRLEELHRFVQDAFRECRLTRVELAERTLADFAARLARRHDLRCISTRRADRQHLRTRDDDALYVGGSRWADWRRARVASGWSRPEIGGAPARRQTHDARCTHRAARQCRAVPPPGLRSCARTCHPGFRRPRLTTWNRALSAAHGWSPPDHSLSATEVLHLISAARLMPQEHRQDS